MRGGVSAMYRDARRRPRHRFYRHRFVRWEREQRARGTPGRLMRSLAFFYAALFLIVAALVMLGATRLPGLPGDGGGPGGEGGLAIAPGLGDFFDSAERNLFSMLSRWLEPYPGLHTIIFERGVPALAPEQEARPGEDHPGTGRGVIRSVLLALTDADFSDLKALLTFQIPRIKSKPPQERSKEAITSRGVPVARVAEADSAHDDRRAGELAGLAPGDPAGPVAARPAVRPGPAPSPAELPRGAVPGIQGGARNLEGPREPLVAIYHSHSSEAYRPTSGVDYVWGRPDGVIRVGDEVARVLTEKYNIPVIHSRKVHDFPKWREAYMNALPTIEGILEKHPSIEIVLDIHRDSIPVPAPIPRTVTIKGQKAARIFIVVSNDKFGLPHPRWRENFSFALQLNATLENLYPGLSRGVDLRDDGRWNQHVHPRAVILEIGSVNNTREEALAAARFVADAVAKTLSQIRAKPGP
ncbi:MAG: hypothetical protein HPY71_04560 [Firmicutes bacterium]|nr:hypothetical protein [Bacillota bacterium]